MMITIISLRMMFIVEKVNDFTFLWSVVPGSLSNVRKRIALESSVNLREKYGHKKIYQVQIDVCL